MSFDAGRHAPIRLGYSTQVIGCKACSAGFAASLDTPLALLPGLRSSCASPPNHPSPLPHPTHTTTHTHPAQVFTVKLADEDFEALEDNQVLVQGMMANRYMATFRDDILGWNRSLMNVADVNQIMTEIQRTWAYLESLFIHSEEVRARPRVCVCVGGGGGCCKAGSLCCVLTFGKPTGV